MKALLFVPLTIALELGVCGILVIQCRDRQTLVAPPKMVSEGFIRLLAASRYDMAFERLSDEPKQHVGKADLRKLTRDLRKRATIIEDVRGKSASMNGDRATAQVRVFGRYRKVTLLEISLRWSNGGWRVEQLPKL
jgi:hypothetical protein